MKNVNKKILFDFHVPSIFYDFSSFFFVMRRLEVSLMQLEVIQLKLNEVDLEGENGKLNEKSACNLIM